MIVSVTQDDIDNGKPKSPRCCPVARALKRSFPEYDYISVTQGHMNISNFQDGRTLLTDDHTKEFIFKFDSLLPVHPFSFEVEE